MHEKEPQEPPEHTSEHVKFPGGGAPIPLSHNPFCGAPLLVFALGPPNPLGSPAHINCGHALNVWENSQQQIYGSCQVTPGL